MIFIEIRGVANLTLRAGPSFQPSVDFLAFQVGDGKRAAASVFQVGDGKIAAVLRMLVLRKLGPKRELLEALFFLAEKECHCKQKHGN